MPILYLVRHGRASAGWDADADPGLDPEGRAQAQAVAEKLAPLGPLPLVVSPLARTRETAAALARTWNVEPRIEPRVGEIPSPMQDLKERGQWLRVIATRRWPGLEDTLAQWRADAIAALTALATDTVVVTHFIVINVALGAATGDDRVVHFSPDYCSVTRLRVEDGKLVLVERGAEGRTRVL
jgi:broad specificity phosphatase PhoE